jgi:type IV secretory pathway protease TraF
MDGRRNEALKDGFRQRIKTSRAHKLPQAIASDGRELKLACAADEVGRALPELREAQ